jgi:exopolysaccharide biosynthesis polyprenyl glycosylphosphotransferase
MAPLYYWWPAVQLPLRVFMAGVILAGFLLLIVRRLVSALSCWGRLNHPAVLVGGGPLLDPLFHELGTRAELGCHVVGLVHTGSLSEKIPQGLTDLGPIEQLPGLVEREKVDRVIVNIDDRGSRLPVEMLLQLKTHGVAVEDAFDAYEAITEKVPPDALRPARLLSSRAFYIPRALRLYKRFGSIVVSVFGLLVSLPIQLLIAITIKLDSRGPAIFKQERIGKDGRPFLLYKFRTMVVNADRNRPAEKDDHRCTRVGRWLRRTRLDELPQLFNILRGDMHLIGPRPFTCAQEQQLAGQIPFYTQRWAVCPGLTGWAQIHRDYCETLEDNIEKLSYDLFYIKNISIGLDLIIFLQTVKILLLGRGSR